MHDLRAMLQGLHDVLLDTIAACGDDARSVMCSVNPHLSALHAEVYDEFLGGIESLVAHPATMTHASTDPQARRIAGITDTLLRLSVGLEGEGDLVEDLSQALEFTGTGAEALAR